MESQLAEWKRIADELGTDRPFVDPDFPHELESIFGSELQNGCAPTSSQNFSDSSAMASNLWLRFTQIEGRQDAVLMKEGNQLAAGVLLGQLLNGSLLGAIGALAERAPESLRGMFVFSAPQVGLYVVRLYRFHEPLLVVVDEFVPVTQHGSDTTNAQCLRLSVGCSVDRSQSYVTLIEKAYAKLVGSYSATAHHSLEQLGISLVSKAPYSIQIQQLPAQSACDTVWQLLQRNKRQLLVEVSRGGGDEPVHSCYVSHLHDSEQHEGIRLLQLRFPYAIEHLAAHAVTERWHGKYGALSSGWLPQLLDSHNEQPPGGPVWQTIEDFVKTWRQLTLCDASDSVCVNSALACWDKESSAGGASDKLHRNPQFWLLCPEPCDLTVTLVLVNATHERDLSVSVAVIKEGVMPRSTRVCNNKVSAQLSSSKLLKPLRDDCTQADSLNMVQKQIATWRYRMPGSKRPYVLVPYTSLAGQQCKFELRVAASCKTRLGLYGSHTYNPDGAAPGEGSNGEAALLYTGATLIVARGHKLESDVQTQEDLKASEDLIERSKQYMITQEQQKQADADEQVVGVPQKGQPLKWSNVHKNPIMGAQLNGLAQRARLAEQQQLTTAAVEVEVTAQGLSPTLAELTRQMLAADQQTAVWQLNEKLNAELEELKGSATGRGGGQLLSTAQLEDFARRVLAEQSGHALTTVSALQLEELARRTHLEQLGPLAVQEEMALRKQQEAKCNHAQVEARRACLEHARTIEEARRTVAAACKRSRKGWENAAAQKRMGIVQVLRDELPDSVMQAERLELSKVRELLLGNSGSVQKADSADADLKEPPSIEEPSNAATMEENARTKLMLEAAITMEENARTKLMLEAATTMEENARTKLMLEAAIHPVDLPITLPLLVQFDLVDVQLSNLPRCEKWPHDTCWFQYAMQAQQHLSALDHLSNGPLFKRAAFPHTFTEVADSALGKVEPFSAQNAALFVCLWLALSDEQALQWCSQHSEASFDCYHSIQGTSILWGDWQCCESPLHIAAGRGWPKTLLHILERGVKVDTTNGSGSTPLLLAVQRGHVEVAFLLLQWGAAPTAADSGGLQVLHHAVMAACTAQSLELLMVLIDQMEGDVMSAVNDSHWTVLHAACLPSMMHEAEAELHGQIRSRLIPLLIDSKAQVDYQTTELVTPLMLAVYYDTEWDQLLECGANHALRNRYNESAFDIVRKARENESLHPKIDRTECFDLMQKLDAGWNIDYGATSDTRPTSDARPGSSSKVNFAAGNSSPDTHHDAQHAAATGQTTENGTSAGRSAVTVSGPCVETGARNDSEFKNSEADQMQDSEGCGTDTDADRMPHRPTDSQMDRAHRQRCTPDEALHRACSHGNAFKVMESLKNGADVEYIGKDDEDCRRPLHWACMNEHTSVVQLLLQHNANVNAVTATGATPLQLSVANHSQLLCKMLVDHGADPSVLWDLGQVVERELIC